MFDKLEAIEERYNDVLKELSGADVASDQNKFKKLMKEQSDLLPIVESYRQYKNAKKTIEDSLEILDTESDEELKEMAKEELAAAKRIWRALKRLSRSSCSRKMKMTTRTWSLRSGQEQAVTKQPCLRQNSTVCTAGLRN